MKGLLTQLIYKIQMLAMTQLFELFLWITISGSVSALIVQYLRYQHIMNNFIFETIFIIFIYYAGYKLIMK